jgi:hypothetical protein
MSILDLQVRSLSKASGFKDLTSTASEKTKVRGKLFPFRRKHLALVDDGHEGSAHGTRHL